MDTIITETLRGFELKFKTKPGIFSPHGVDSGTKLLIDNLQIRKDSLAADLGAGNGILGLTLAKLNYGGHVHLLDDHLRSVELLKENTELNDLRNAEVFLSDLFSAVANRTYQQIFSNPSQQLGNDFLEEIIKESYKHLKDKGELWLVVKRNIKPLIERLFEKYFKNCKIVATGKEHVVIKGVKNGDKN